MAHGVALVPHLTSRPSCNRVKLHDRASRQSCQIASNCMIAPSRQIAPNCMIAPSRQSCQIAPNCMITPSHQSRHIVHGNFIAVEHEDGNEHDGSGANFDEAINISST
ncbi:hypothetical protein E2562_004557 [Oryza meyeriana var. granulata]|uniref:Uncharacterized protein n=1 Tax=Oryza meyeriana var. granulata TaxID=110450 RepID=A0A6G1F3F6_9ORYZ|nr:hypothetical protein E2562_004557 [Oryza meyeriana var. granulata]